MFLHDPPLPRNPKIRRQPIFLAKRTALPLSLPRTEEATTIIVRLGIDLWPAVVVAVIGALHGLVTLIFVEQWMIMVSQAQALQRHALSGVHRCSSGGGG